MFSSSLNITINCEIEMKIHEKCHHDIIYGTLIFNLPLRPPYYREIWDYEHESIENIKNVISMLDCQKAFKNKISNEMTRILTDTLMNIFKNFIPHKTKRSDCKHPKWMNSFIISSLKKRRKCTKRLCKNPSYSNENLVNNQANERMSLIIQTKEKYMAKKSAKLDNPNTAPKAYWSIISRFVSKRKCQPYHLFLLIANWYLISK